MSGGLAFSVLGPVRAWRDGVELDLGSPQQRAVLAMLLLADGRRVTLDTLRDRLWDGQPPRSAVAAVRTYVSRLRKPLRTGAEPAVPSVADGYVLPVGPGTLDVRRFEEATAQARLARGAGETARSASLLREALGLWRGAALAGIPGRWADTQRVRLEDRRRTALEDRLALDIELGAHVAAATELSELTSTDPLREPLAQLLMLALCRSGRQADALAVFTTTRRRLAEELGTDPGPALRQLNERILRTA